jgi:hypothetical protein
LQLVSPAFFFDWLVMTSVFSPANQVAFSSIGAKKIAQ